MAWTCSGTTNDELVDKLVAANLLTSPRVEAAFRAVDRAHFVRNGAPYQDTPQVIGYGATISAPHMHAHFLESVEAYLKPGSKICDVGSGSGILLAMIHHLIAGPGSLVIGIDHIPELVEQARQNLSRSPTTLSALTSTPPSIILHTGDGREGAPAELLDAENKEMFDCIHVGCAAPGIPPHLTDQLKRGGRMFVPIGEADGAQYIYLVDKDSFGNVEAKKLFGVRYIPLTDPATQLN